MIMSFIDTTGVLRDKTLFKTYEKLDKTFNTIFGLLVPDGEAKLELVRAEMVAS